MFSFRTINSTSLNTNIEEAPPQFRVNQNQFMFPSYRYSIPARSATATAATKLIEPDEPKMRWGEPTWNLFHTIAEKILPENFFNIRSELFEIFKMICYNLPCPDCANHARNYINKINFNNINTPSQLKDMLFVFHNFVNSKKHFAQFERSALDARYQAFNLKATLQLFLYHFRDKHKSSRMLADDLYRSKLANKIEKWFVANFNLFGL